MTPTDLRDALSGGATWGTLPVARVVLFGRGGEILADSAVPPAAKDWAKTAAGEAILGLLRESPLPLSGRQIAEALGYSYVGGFREKLTGLVSARLIHKDDQGFFSLPR